MVNRREQIDNLLRLFEERPKELHAAEEYIHVSPATKRLAFAYERFRNTLEPDEEEILRRKAIERILERRLFEDRPPVAVATTVLQELIRANYIKASHNSLAEIVAITLNKTRYIYSKLQSDHAQWFLKLAAVAVDHHLYPPEQQEALVHLMYHDTYRRTAWIDNYIADEDRPTQLYLACHRALFAADNSELAYLYFSHQFPVWHKREISTEELDDLAMRIPAFREYMEATLNHPGRDRLTRLMRPLAVPYLVIRDLLKDDREKALADNQALDAAAFETFSNRIRNTRSRMSRRAWHSILFLFITKTILALSIEVPYEQYVQGEIHYLALATNIAFHPILLFFLATAVRFPGRANTERVVDQVKKVITGEGELPTVIIDAPRQYGAAIWSAFAIIYTVLFMFIFWALFTFLDTLQFSLLAMSFFVVFLGLVSFFATRIRRSVDDLRIVPRGDTIISASLSFIALPILEFGRWLAQNIQQLNVLLFFMDRVLEAPFKLLIDVTEEWFAFVRDRREDIVK